MNIKDLYIDVLKNAIKCNMDQKTILNLKEWHAHQIKNDFSWLGYEHQLKTLNKMYRSTIS